MSGELSYAQLQAAVANFLWSDRVVLCSDQSLRGRVAIAGEIPDLQGFLTREHGMSLDLPRVPFLFDHRAFEVGAAHDRLMVIGLIGKLLSARASSRN